jgi:transcriptional regulator with GAF, ATPase, and Fis domain
MVSRIAKQTAFVWAIVLVTALVLTLFDVVAHLVPTAYRPGLLPQILTALPLVLLVAYLGGRLFTVLTARLEQKETARLEALGRVEYLEARNAILQMVAASTDTIDTVRTLARHIARVVPCDRVGLALLSEDGQELHTYTGQPADGDEPPAAVVDLHFQNTGTHVDAVLTSGEPLIVNDMSAVARDFLDANVSHSAGFASAILMPLVFAGKKLGTLNLLSAKRNAFVPSHVQSLIPVAQTISLACGTQQLAQTLTRTRSAHETADLAFSMANDISSAMQVVVGQCELLQREYADSALQRDVATIALQSRRVLENLHRLRALARAQAHVTQSKVPAPHNTATGPPDDLVIRP